MDIECTLKRDGGSKIDLVTREYHFTPRADGAQVADVEEESHIARLLAIPEAYRIYRAQPASAVMALDFTDSTPKATVVPVPVTLMGSAGHSDTFTIHGVVYTQTEIVGIAAAIFKPEDWNGLSDDARADLVDDVLDDLEAHPERVKTAVPAQSQPPQEPQPPVDEAAVMAKLKAQYQAKFGKKPHHMWSAEKIRTELAA